MNKLFVLRAFDCIPNSRVINIAEGKTVQLSCAEEGFEEFPEEYFVSAR